MTFRDSLRVRAFGRFRRWAKTHRWTPRTNVFVTINGNATSVRRMRWCYHCGVTSATTHVRPQCDPFDVG